MQATEAVIIGAGAVGVNTAIFLKRIGLGVELIELGPDILQGSTLASFVNHGDGLEYYKPGHVRTGMDCIDGSLFKGLIYPLSAFMTSVCDEKNPIRFFVSKDSVRQGDLSLSEFHLNAETMQNHFARQFKSIVDTLGLKEEEARNMFLRLPDNFTRKLGSEEWSDVINVVGGSAGSSFGINMPHYYAFLEAALKRLEIKPRMNCTVEAIEKSSNSYIVHAGGSSFRGRQILLAAGHQIPRLWSKIRGASTAPPYPGTYFLNSMTFLKLPATADQEKLACAKHINFTLQQDHGAMLACIVPPSAREDGAAAIYYPSCQGSQLREHLFDPTYPVSPPAEWNQLIEEGIPQEDPRVQSTFEQACRFYPFLKGYAHIEHTTCRSVFNAATESSNNGTDRRERDISGSPSTVTSDGMITTWAAPKWTNAELVALMATNYVSERLQGTVFAKSDTIKFGPLGIDIVKIIEAIGFRHLTMSIEDALRYAARQKLPDRVVNTELPQFRKPVS